MAFGPGTEVAGYRLERLIGEGGMAQVFLGEHTGDGSHAAIKVLRQEMARDADLRERFLREAGYAESLEHPNIVRVFESGESDGRLFIASEYVQGTDLYTLLEAGPLEPDLTLAILTQVAAALDAAHATGLLHRDVKPGNVLVAAGAGRRPRCYLTDFGLSKHMAGDIRALTNAGDFVGTIEYTAPEQILSKEADRRVDVYSLGCLLYECLAGRSPFGGQEEVQVMQSHIEADPPALSEVAVGVPAQLDAVVAKALAKEPGERYASCGELVAAAAAAAGMSPGATDARVPAPSATPRVALTLQVTGGNAAGTEIAVADELVIGREAEGPGRLGEDAQISRRHARVARTPDESFSIEDLGSTNGTFVNGRQIATIQPLADGDSVELGDTTLVAQLVSAPSPAGARLTVHLEIDLEAGELQIEIDGAPARLVRDGDRWLPAG